MCCWTLGRTLTSNELTTMFRLHRLQILLVKWRNYVLMSAWDRSSYTRHSIGCFRNSFALWKSSSVTSDVYTQLWMYFGGWNRIRSTGTRP